ncbi:hypothetical protein QFC21_005262 [Naganishia friedmannii]|uniref:Uncharacterized protein n=1 Tax=Naganishia friedmannii TaxID=89922 RepID=A0ACC2VBH1_9TREE|nr:hypothetical protein QFC21_005262 [Naganishia friedmannii]
MSRFYTQRQHSRRTSSAARMEMRHVIDMTQVDEEADAEEEASRPSDDERGSSAGASAGKSETEMRVQVDEVEEEKEEPERQVLPGDLLHALATLETFRRMADAGINDEWGLGAGTVRQMAFFNSVGGGNVPRRNNLNANAGDAQRRNGDGSGNNKETGVAADIEVNLDGRVPARAKFSRGEAMYDIPIEPLAEWLSSLTDPDHLEKVRYTLENAATPYDYFRIDERINEAYQPHAIHDLVPNNNAYAPWISAGRSAKTDVPNVPIVRELRIDITTLHPSAIYRLEQLRRRQLRQRVLPMRMDVWVEEKESEWIKQRTKEKRAAQRVEREKERQRLQAEEEEERQRLAEEKRKQQEETVRRHLGLSTGTSSRRNRRSSEHDPDHHSDRSSEMSPVPSNVSSPSPPPPQIFHEVQESVPFPFATPSLPVAASSQPAAATSSRPPPPSPTPQPRSARPTCQTTAPDEVIDLTEPDIPVAVPRRIKFKFKGASLSLFNPNHKQPAKPVESSSAGPETTSQQTTPKAGPSNATSITERAPFSARSNGSGAKLPNGDTRPRRPPPILSHASLAELGAGFSVPSRADDARKRTEAHKGTPPPPAVLSGSSNSPISKGHFSVEEEVHAQQKSTRGLPTTTGATRDSPRSTSTRNVVEKLGNMLKDQQAAETSAGRHNDSADRVVIDLTLALDGDEVDVGPVSNDKSGRTGAVLPSHRARRRITLSKDPEEPAYIPSSSQQQDEEDEARVEELDILGEANPDDSPDCTVQVDDDMPGFMEESRSNRGKASSSARSREVIIIIDDDTDEDDVGTVPKTTPIPSTSTSSASKRAALQSPGPASISAEQVSSVDRTLPQRDTGDNASAIDASKQQDTDMDMMIDNELEPVSLEDTRSWELQRDSPPPKHAAESPDNNKGPQRSSGHKGKARADQLNLTINTPSNDRTQVDGRSEKWAASSKVIQIRGITGPTATDTEDTSADTTSANTPLRSPPPILPGEHAAHSAPPRTLPVPLVAPSSYAPPPSSAPALPATVDTLTLLLPPVPIVPSAKKKTSALAAPLASDIMTNVMPPLPEPSVTVQTVQMSVESQSQSVPNSARGGLARQRQSEAFYAALASSFLNRCGAAPSLPSMYDAGSSSQMRHHPPGLWFNSSKGTSQSSSTPPDQFMSLHRASMTTTCDPRDVFGQIKAEVPDVAPSSESIRNDVNTSSDTERQDEDQILERARYRKQRRPSRELSPLKPPTMQATITPAASRSQPAEVSDDEFELQETTWHRQGRSSRGKRKNYAEVPLEDIRPPKRQRTSASSRNSRARLYDVPDDSDDEEPIWVSGRNLRYGETVLEVCIPIKQRPFSPSPPPLPRIPRPNLKIILKV